MAFYGGEAYDQSGLEAEGRPFKAALDNMEVWSHADRDDEIVLLTETPDGRVRHAITNLKIRPTFQSSVAMLINAVFYSTWFHTHLRPFMSARRPGAARFARAPAQCARSHRLAPRTSSTHLPILST